MSLNVVEIPVSRIFMDERQREDYGDIEAMKFSIEQYGLLQPIVVEPRPEEKYLLIAGGRRLTAYKSLNRKTIPAIFRANIDELTRKELEYEENIQRKSLTWVEECKAVAEIHRIKKKQFATNFPDKFGRNWSQKETAQALNMSEGKVSQDVTIAEALAVHPELAQAGNRKDALRMLRHLEENCVPDEGIYLKKLRDCFINASPEECASKVLSSTVDCIITDLTGLDYEAMIKLLASKLTFSGNAWIFIPFEQLSNVQKILKENNLPFRAKPFVWHIKGEDNYQIYVWFSRALADPPKMVPDHFSCKRDKTNLHTMAKPYQLYYTLLENCTKRNQLMMDINAYDTTLVRCAIEHSRNVVAFCSNKTLHEQGILNAKQGTGTGTAT